MSNESNIRRHRDGKFAPHANSDSDVVIGSPPVGGLPPEDGIPEYDADDELRDVLSGWAKRHGMFSSDQDIDTAARVVGVLVRQHPPCSSPAVENALGRTYDLSGDSGETLHPDPERLAPKLSLRASGISMSPGYPDHVLALKEIADSRRAAGEDPIPLYLRRDPDNQHDPNAIEVSYLDDQGDTRSLGFVPKDIARQMSAEMDRGETWNAHVGMVVVHRDHMDRPGVEIKFSRQTDNPYGDDVSELF